MIDRTVVQICLCIAVLCIGGCSVQTNVDNAPGRPTRYVDPRTPGPVKGIGVESQDIASMCDRMMRDILNAPQIAARQVPPFVVVDDKYFTNTSSSRINKKLITDQLRVELNRAARSRMYFVSRENIDIVEEERLLKREGVVTSGTLGTTPATAGVDFKLTGSIASLDGVVTDTGLQSRYHQITFELIDQETGIIAWSGRYEFEKVGQDNVVYR